MGTETNSPAVVGLTFYLGEREKKPKKEARGKVRQMVLSAKEGKAGKVEQGVRFAVCTDRG